MRAISDEVGTSCAKIQTTMPMTITENGYKKGRPSLLTPEFQEKYVNAVKDLRYLNLAADLVGVNIQTINRWRKEGRKHEETYHPDGDDCTINCDTDLVAKRSFYTAVKTAIAEAVQSDLQDIEIIAKRSNKWEGIAWKLERTMPDKFGMKNRIDHKHSGKVEHTVKLLPVEQRQRILKAANDALMLETTQDENGVFIPVQDED